MSYIARRPAWQHRMAFEVPADLYKAAHEEMQNTMRKRGFPMPTDRNLEVEHFLCLGTPIIARVA